MCSLCLAQRLLYLGTAMQCFDYAETMATPKPELLDIHETFSARLSWWETVMDQETEEEGTEQMRKKEWKRQ